MWFEWIMIFFLSIVIFLSLYFIGNVSSKYFNLSLVEKPIFATGLIIIYLNYFYFLFDISIIYLFYILCMIIAFSIIFLWAYSGISWKANMQVTISISSLLTYVSAFER